MKLLRGAVRDHQATLLVVDGTVTAEKMSPSDIAYKRFIQELKSWVEIVDCTVDALDQLRRRPERRRQARAHDGRRHDAAHRPSRSGCVFRASCACASSAARATSRDFTRTPSPATGSSSGRASRPACPTCSRARRATRVVPLGVAGLDTMLEGGVRRDSVTLLVGATGVGKTMLGAAVPCAKASRAASRACTSGSSRSVGC